MLSRREKILVRPWEDRRFNNHRMKVRSALPAIDVTSPPDRPHVSLKLKKLQKEQDRKRKIELENFSLLQRLNDIMNVNRLDNHWTRPLPNLNKKLGMFFESEILSSKLSARSASEMSDTSYANVKCFACELRKRNVRRLTTIQTESKAESLPSIF